MRRKIWLIALLLFANTAFAETLEARQSFLAGYHSLSQGKYVDSIRSFKAVLADPSYPLQDYSYYFIASAYQKNKHYPEAVQVYQIVKDYFKTSVLLPRALTGISECQLEMAGPQPPAATAYALGLKHFNDRDYANAIAYFRRIINAHKKSAFVDKAYLMLGRIYMRKGNLARSADCLNKVISFDKDSKPEALYYLARARAYQNRTQQALDILKKVYTLYPNSSFADDALYYSGKFHQSLGNHARAFNLFEEVTAKYPGSDLYTEAIWTVGSLYYKAGKYQETYDYLSRAFSPPAQRSSAQIYYWAAKAAEKAGNQENAIAAYKTAIARFDHSYYGYRSREELVKFGVNLALDAVPDTPELSAEFSGENHEHQAKYEELLALGLGEEAEAEADFLIEKAPAGKKEQVELAKYHAYIVNGKFSKPMKYAQEKIDQAVLSGNLSSLDPHLWKFCYPRGFEEYVQKYAKQYGVDPFLVYAVIREESYFNSRALSSSRAHGLMQIIPSTGRKLSRLLGISYSRWKLYNPRVNIQMGSYYLSRLIEDFNGNVALALAAYNGGPVRVKRWLKKYDHFDLDEFVEEIPLSETRNYVKKVLKSYYGYKRTYGG